MSKINVDPDKIGQDRYQMPPVKVRSQRNNKTYFTNMQEVATDLNRTSEELLKYLGFYLNTQTNTSQLCFNGVYSTEKMQEAVYDYILAYVLCPVCKNPETTIALSKSKKLKIKCAACGCSQEIGTSNSKFDKWLLSNIKQ
jgi:translation initiation factor 5